VNVVQKGQLVRSLSGRDKDKYYLVLGREGDTLYLSDGRKRGVQNPKKKNIQPNSSNLVPEKRKSSSTATQPSLPANKRTAKTKSTAHIVPSFKKGRDLQRKSHRPKKHKGAARAQAIFCIKTPRATPTPTPPLLCQKWLELGRLTGHASTPTNPHRSPVFRVLRRVAFSTRSPHNFVTFYVRRRASCMKKRKVRFLPRAARSVFRCRWMNQGGD